MFFIVVLAALVLLVLGCLFCFAGYRFFLILMPIWGFIAGFAFTASAIQDFFGGGFLATTASWVFGLFVGLIVGALAYFYYYGAVIAILASVGFAIGEGIVIGFGARPGLLSFLIGALFALVASVVSIYFHLPQIVVVVFTALNGAAAILTSILLAFGTVTLGSLQDGDVGDIIRASWAWLLAYIVLAAAGVAVQRRALRKYTLQPRPRPAWLATMW
ncbi:MAG TPA: DUF4203 domain-containing protein [Ktedonobacterales bacterium]|nr:DUF4203 domain-containing protein [Ktedonobacterales bacterium]